RLLWGYSMGGFNAAQLLLRDGFLFERVVLLSPAFLTVSPFAPKEEVDAYITRNHLNSIGRFKVQTFIGLLKKNYKTPEQWAANDPLELSKEGLPASAKVYVSDGDQDDYGFHEGAELFVRQAPTRGARLEWESLKGGHHTTNPEAIAKFLLP
ncbi:MAG: alpha/beta hydrolase-fold protein, partial [Bdellovibrionota bacterium]